MHNKRKEKLQTKILKYEKILDLREALLNDFLRDFKIKFEIVHWNKEYTQVILIDSDNKEVNINNINIQDVSIKTAIENQIELIEYYYIKLFNCYREIES